MSMNLIFDVKESPAIVSFPYQTSTSLTFAGLAEDDNDKRIALIKEDIDGWANYDDEEKKDMLNEVVALINSPALELSLI